MVITLKLDDDVARSLLERLRGELKSYEQVIEQFRRKYGCGLEELEARIERGGVPTGEGHEVWEDGIEWRNAVEEVERLRPIVEELEKNLRGPSREAVA